MESPRLGSLCLGTGLENLLKLDFFLPQRFVVLENGSMVHLQSDNDKQVSSV